MIRKCAHVHEALMCMPSTQARAPVHTHMHAYACMRMYVHYHVQTCVNTNKLTTAHLCKLMHMRMHTHICTQLHTNRPARTCACACDTCSYVCAHNAHMPKQVTHTHACAHTRGTCMCAHARTHTHTHACTHSRMHARTQAHAESCARARARTPMDPHRSCSDCTTTSSIRR